MTISSNSSIITPIMKKEITTTKITKKSLKLVRLISAYTGEKQYEVIERLLDKELKHVREKENA